MHLTLATFPLFNGLTSEELIGIAKKLEQPQAFSKGDVIYRSDDFRRAIGLVISGSVAVQKQALMMNRLTCGDMFGVAALFGGEDTYVTQITAEEKTEILFLPQETVAALLHDYPTVAENYIRFLSGRIRFLNRKVAALSAGSAEHRLYEYLLSHSDAQGHLQLPPSMVELAHTLNIGRSSLYRSLDTLQQAGVLVKEQHGYRLVK